MKKIVLSSIVALTLANADTNIHGGVDLKSTNINGTSAMLVGGGGGITYKNGISIGGAGYGLYNDNIKASGSYSNKNLSLGYGGMLIGYHTMANNIFSLNTTVLLGGGGIKAGTDDGDTGTGGFVAEVGTTAHLNLTKYVGLQAGVSYRYFNSTDAGGLSANDINGLTYSVGLLFHLYQ